MLFCNPDIKESVRKHPCKSGKSGSIRHGCCNSDYCIILLCNITEYFGKNIGIAVLRALLFCLPGLNVKRNDPVKSGWILLRGNVSLSFLGEYMNQNCMIYPFCLLKCLIQLSDIMPVHRSQVGDSHIFEKHTRNK